MPKTKQILVGDLSLDLKNFRTVEQPNETEAVKAMISISPDYFWALADSLVDDGYLPTENIIAIKGSTPNSVIVKEGNRRIAVLKIAYGLIPTTQLNLPAPLSAKISQLSASWKSSNKTVPCSIFEPNEDDMVDKIISLAHGKGEKAGRDPWTSVARARHNRDVNGVTELGLDLLEKYLQHGRNLTGQQKERFAGDYPISVLDAAIAKVYGRIGVANSAALVNVYPTNTLHFQAIEDLILAIGLKQVGFDKIRSTSVDFAVALGFPPIPQPSPQPNPPSPNPPGPTTSPPNPNPPAPNPPAPSPPNPNPPAPSPPVPPPAQPTTTPRSVLNKLSLFRPTGNDREKVVDLRNEIQKLNIANTPLAFCFLLRSLFDISAKVYCGQHNIATTYTNRNGGVFDRKLVDLLADATADLTASNPGLTRQLHGALTELQNNHSILSVTSMNQLIHNPHFSVAVSDVCRLFHNIYPLLEALN
jgi:hypothetical protein